MQDQSASSNKIGLKLPLFLFVAVLIAKIGYVIVESFYNYYVFITTTSANLTQESVEQLNQNGHIISAFGITLLLIPVVFFFIRRFLNKYLYVSILLSSVIIYAAAYSSLEYAIEKIVELNKEKRHDAYYVNVFKYGVLNNIFAYDSFVDSAKVLNNTLDVNDRILFTNTFLLLHADEALITKLKERGKEKVSELYVEMYKKEDYESKFREFEKASKEVADAWNEFNDKRKELRNGIAKLNELTSENGVKKAHADFIDNLQSKYKEYQKGWQSVENKIAEATTPPELSDSKERLQKYFRYQDYDEAKQKYKKSMNDQFGHYIEPKRWLDSSGDVTEAQIKKVVTEEIVKKASSSINIERGLSPKEFLNHVDVKIQISNELKKNGIIIPYEFDYSLTSFKRYYVVPFIKKHNQAESDFYKKLEEKIGKNDLKLNMEWESFVKSRYIREQINTKLKDLSEADQEKIIKAIISKDLGNFKKMIYMPKVIDQVNEMLYSPKDFEDGGKAAKSGDDAIKLLYRECSAFRVSIG
ncbi:MAG: hypothetical protein WC272_11630 [Sulfurimonas sp.]|jgi:hypothetical protein